MRFKAAFLIIFVVILNSFCLSQTPASSSGSPVTPSTSESLAQAASLLSATEQTASISAAISASTRRGKKGVVTAEALLNIPDHTASVAGEVTARNVEVNGKSKSAAELDREVRKLVEDDRESAREPVAIRFNSPGSEADSPDQTARLRYQYVTTSRPHSRLAFLKAIFPKRLKTFWRRDSHKTASLHGPADISTVLLTTVNHLTDHSPLQQLDAAPQFQLSALRSEPPPSSGSLLFTVCRNPVLTL